MFSLTLASEWSLGGCSFLIVRSVNLAHGEFVSRRYNFVLSED